MLENKNGLSLDLVIHPGETVREILLDREMSQEELAIRTGYSAKHVSKVINGKENISANFADKLECALNIPTSFWINLQGIYDKELIELEKENNIFEEEFEVFKNLNEIVKYCEEIEVISKNASNTHQLLEMRKFLNISNLISISNLPLQQVAFRTTKNKVNEYVMFAWQRICQHSTDTKVLKKDFDKKLLESRLEDIKNTMFLEANQMILELKKIFSECGISFAVVKHFKGAPVQGFIQRKDNKIILCMTIRQSFADIFWFTLFHEIGHLINDDIKDKFIDYTFIEEEIEEKADAYARESLIPEKEYDTFVKTSELNKNSILNFARKQKVIPGIVVGRIQRDIADYKFLSNLRLQYKWR